MHMTALSLEQVFVFLLPNSLNDGFTFLVNQHMLQLFFFDPIWYYSFDLSQHFRKITLPHHSFFVQIEYLYDIRLATAVRN
jgi:hypothetical protein